MIQYRESGSSELQSARKGESESDDRCLSD